MTSGFNPSLTRANLKILLVEDNASDAELITELLLENRLASELILTKVVRVSEAIERLQQENFDVILLDISLPDSQGFDTVARVREYCLNIPIVVLTGNTSEELALQSIQAGAQDYLVKIKLDSEVLSRSLRYAIERQRSQEALRQSEQKYRSFVHSVKEVIFQTDLAGHWIFLNPVWTDLTGFTLSESLGTPFFNYIDSSERQRSLEEFCALIEQQKDDCRLKIRVPTASGKVRWLELHQRLTFAPDGTVSGTVGTLNDITDRTLAQEALHESEIRWQSYFENSLVGIAITAPSDKEAPENERWIDVNAALCKLLGYLPEELLKAKTWAELTHPDDLETELAQLLQVHAGEIDGYVLDKRLLKKDGQVVYAKVSVRPIFRKDGSIYRWIAVVVDMSDRYRYEQQLKASEEFLHHALDAVADPIFVKNEQHQFVFVNKALCQFINYPREQLIGQWDYDFFSKEQADIFWEKDEFVLKTNQENQNEEVLTDANGEKHIVASQKTVFENSDGSKILVGIIRDVTHYKRQQVALQQSESRFQKMADNLPGMLYQYRLSTDGEISFPYISSGCRDIYEVELEEMQKNPSLSFAGVHPDDFVDLNESITLSASTLQPWQREWRQIMRSGKIKWLQGASRPERQANGDIIWDGLVMDITELRQAQQERDRFFTISLDLLAIAGLDGYFKRFNPAWLTALGYTEAEFLSQPFIQFVHPDDRLSTLAEVHKLANGIPTINFENRYLCKDGSYKWLAWRAAPSLEEGLIYAVAHDITERKQAEQALWESQRFIQQIAEASPNILYVFDLVEQRNVYANREIAALLGYSKEEIQAMGAAILPNLMHPDDLARLPDYYQQFQTAKEGDIFEMEYRMRHSSGEWRWLISRETLFARTADGKPQQILGTASNITEIKQKTEQLAKSARLSALRSEIGFALAQSGDLSSILNLCAEALIEHLDVAFARFWTLNPDDNILELQASAGLYTHLNGQHARVPVGRFKIGLIAAEKKPHLTNNVQNDSRISDKEWAIKEGMEAFAGYPLIVEDRLVGVMAMFARQTLSQEILDSLGLVANEIAVGIERKQAAIALQLSQEQLQLAIEGSDLGLWDFNIATGETYFDASWKKMLGYEVDEIENNYQSWIRLLNAEDLPGVMEILNAYLEGRTPVYEVEFRMLTKQGEWKWIMARGKAFEWDESGKPIRMTGTHKDISDRIAAERSLVRLTRQLQEAQKIAHIGNWEFDIITGIVTWSDELFHIYGREIGQTPTFEEILQQIHANDRERWLQVVEQSLSEGTSYDIDHRIYLPNGKIKYINGKGQALKNQSGKVVRLFGTAMDITDRASTEEALKESEQRFRALFENAAIGIAQVWPDGQFLKVNSGFCNIVGYSESELRARTFMEITHPDDLEANREWIRQLTSGEIQRFSMEKRFICKDGTYVWVNVTVSLVLEVSGETKYIVKVVEDISDRKQAEESLRQQLKREVLVGTILERIRSSLNLEEVLNNAAEAVRQFLQTDRVLVYRIWENGTGTAIAEAVNSGLLQVLGRTFPEEVFPKKSQQLYRQGRTIAIADMEKASVIACLREFVKEFNVKAQIVVPILQNEKLWGLLIVHHCSAPHPWQEFEIESIKQISVQLAIAIQQSTLFEQAKTEIAERKQVEAALRDSELRERSKALQLELALNKIKNTQAHLVQAEKMASLGQLVAGIAHEINNPVSFIYGNLSPANQYASELLQLLQLYQRYYPEPPTEILDEIEAIDLEYLSEDLPKLLNSMKVGAERIREIVKSLRTFSRLDQSEKKSIDIHEGIESTLMILQHRLKAAGEKQSIQILKTYEKLPLVECYAGQLNQVFMNILANAIDALEERSPSTIARQPSAIAIRTYLSKERRVAISIADNGPGMPESVRKKLFDPFFTTKPVGKGTGLGLSISHSIVVDRHGGKLSCVSTLGQGTEFIIEIPQKL